MGQKILALELGANHVRAAVADRSRSMLELVGVYEQERVGEESDLGGALNRIVDQAGKPDIVISALPGEYVAKRLLTLPFHDRRRLKQVVPFALEEHLPFAVDDAAVAFARVGAEDDQTLVIAAFARKEELRRHLDLLARSGLDPKTVTLSTLALAGLLTRVRNGHRVPHLVLDLDHACTSMVLIDAGGTPRAMRTVGQGLDPESGNPLLQPAAAAILGAVRQTLLAHPPEHEPAELVLAGPVAAAPELRGQIADVLDVPVRDFGEFDCSALIQGTRSEPVRFAGCVAMLLGEAAVKPLELLNFRLGEFSFTGRSVSIAPLRVPAMLAAAVVGVALLHFVLGIAVNVRELHLLNREIASVTAPALPDADPANAKLVLAAKIKDMTKRLHLMGGSLSHGSPLDVLLALSRAIPPGLPAQVSTLQIDDSGIKLDGEADSLASVDLVKHALENNGAFETIAIEHAGAGSDPGKVEFRLSATLRDEAGAL
jgi:Type II secretion system (T2SS), protein L/Fimbrial assembly protein (PilN)